MLTSRPPCPTIDTADVNITITNAPEAGTTTDFYICEGDTVTLAQLNASLSGADSGGTWSPALGGAGTYTYTVLATGQATVSIEVDWIVGQKKI